METHQTGEAAPPASYTHDDLTRVASANCGTPWSQSFAYDAFGNLSKNGSSSFQPTYSYLTNQMTEIGSSTPTYDANGNVTNDFLHTYAWDADGRPVTIDGVGVTYDAMGRMVEEDKSGQYTEIYYSPSGFKMKLMNGTSLVKSTVPLPGGTAEIFTPGATYFRHSDWLGSSRLASTSGRAVYYDGAYAPFGESYAETGTTDRSFTGQDQDTVAALYDFPAREYGIQGRWPSPDPAGLAAVDPGDPQTWNRYAYVRNSPLNTVDPSGLDGEPGEPDCWWGTFCTLYGFPIYPPPPIPSGFVAGPNPPIDWQTLVFGPFNPALLITFAQGTRCLNASKIVVNCLDPSTVYLCTDASNVENDGQGQTGTCAPYAPYGAVNGPQIQSAPTMRASAPKLRPCSAAQKQAKDIGTLFEAQHTIEVPFLALLFPAGSASVLGGFGVMTYAACGAPEPGWPLACGGAIAVDALGGGGILYGNYKYFQTFRTNVWKPLTAPPTRSDSCGG